MSRTYVLRTILVWTLLELLAALQMPAVGGGPVLFSWLRTLIEPVAMVAQGTVDLAVDLGLGARGLQRAMVENREMRIDLETLRARQMLLEADLAALREIGDFAGPDAEFDAGSFVGRCTYRDLISGTMEVRTARFYVLAHDTPVVSADGLVGRVIRSEGHRHWLQLLTHAAAAVAVQTDDSRVHGLALGTGSNALTIAYVPRQAELERGALLVTSGADGIYPPGIPAARVTRIRESDDPFLEVTAVSIADLHAIRMVLILPEWAPATGGGLP
ncbi:MAG: rod shape-determining protein MreC [Thermoanaerobaculales bacterium]|jgi:rod shape-determining protein MreC|nr:rod shape-determining protein MreC [Thermoanaerobaculales bacterium]